MKNVISYVCVVAITLLTAIITGGEFAAFLLGFELLLPLLLQVQIRYLAKNISVHLSVPASAPKEAEVKLEILLENTGKLPVSCVEVKVVCEDGFDEKRITEVLTGIVDGKGVSCMEMGIVAEYAGRINFQIEQVRVYDYFHLLKREVVCEKSFSQLLITPQILDISVDNQVENMQTSQSGDSHSQDKSGDDVSEVFDVREFRAGDTLHRIHWKLSAKTEDLLVKEFSNPLGRAVLLFVDFYKKRLDEWNHEQFDHMATAIASVSNYLLNHQEVHEVLWYDGREEALHRMKIATKEDIYELVGELSVRKPYSQALDFQTILRDSELYEQQVRGFFIDTEGVLGRMEN